MPIKAAAAECEWEACAMAFANAMSQLPRRTRRLIVLTIATTSLATVVETEHLPAGLKFNFASLKRSFRIAGDQVNAAEGEENPEINAFSSGLEEMQKSEEGRTETPVMVLHEETMHLVSAATSFIFASQLAAWREENPSDYRRWDQQDVEIDGVYKSPEAIKIG